MEYLEFIVSQGGTPSLQAACGDPDVLKRGLGRTFRIFTVQTAKMSLMVPISELVIGTYDWREQRLSLRELPVRLTEASLALLIVIATIFAIFLL